MAFWPFGHATRTATLRERPRYAMGFARAKGDRNWSRITQTNLTDKKNL
ncbi:MULTISPECIES: hypothetical protein [Moorena]|nr:MULTISPECIES: hypothetical protein [Moorena]NEQ15003.1 hypothetical protein [Moorena sp. SIO3E2]NEP30040.1 hypothetical protein [Moorena sp. SIO3B2]NEP65496.1 hypothetical protein [Moorena sp. SIO3A5]NEQ04886.1 hypothetical protein [Moorena sp. SIO4E2]NER85636.1 hypothetical protein [Moorena sp. SIO3A2]